MEASSAACDMGSIVCSELSAGGESAMSARGEAGRPIWSLLNSSKNRQCNQHLSGTTCMQGPVQIDFCPQSNYHKNKKVELSNQVESPILVRGWEVISGEVSLELGSDK